ncbi:calcium/sodium antiporter [Halosolutus halophilus]|uniref:calcium/sodium antiporter n=1 Tax=Halosolutus halophilus TaxID=1552990 RepID=UPI00223518DF|nr:calcium/sodium antiporter [Halosolutus halophilus]
MSLVGDVTLVLGGVVALWLGAQWLVTAAATLARAAGISALVVGLTVVAFGTSAPELVVSVGAAFEGRADVAAGNVVGSNVFNLAFTLGLVAVVRPFRVSEKLVRRDTVAMAATTAVGIAVLANLVVSSVEGGLLLALFAAYLGWIWRTVTRSAATERHDAGSPTTDPASPTPAGGDSYEPNRDAESIRYGAEGARLLVGLALVLVGGRLLVDGASGIALSMGVSEWVVGVTIVAGGTSLPELATSIVATRHENLGIAAGNVVGSNVFNVLVVLGSAAVVRPLSVDGAVLSGLAWLALVTAIASAVLATGRRLSRLEGVGLLAIGASYWVWTIH